MTLRRGPLAWSDSTRVLAGLLLGLAVGVVIALSGSTAGQRFAAGIQPIGTLWVNAIRMTVIPLVVSLLITGVASVADLRAVGQLGRRTLGVFAGLLAGSAVVSLVVATTLFTIFPDGMAGKIPLPSGAEDAAREVAGSAANVGVMEWFTTLVPANPVAAAATGSMVSLIVFTVLLALAIARSAPAARAPLVRFFFALGEAMLVLVGWVIALAPIAVFALVLPLAAQAGATLVGAVGFYILAFAITCAIVTALFYVVVRAAGGPGFAAFGRAVLPTQLIGISCSSSVASLPAMVTSAEALAVPPRVSGFVLPLAVSVFKPAAPVAWIVGVLFIGEFYGVPVGARSLAIVAAASVFLSFAAPGVPRGAFLLLTPLFTAIGLPAAGIGVLIAVDLVPDMCATVVNVTGDVAAATLVARGEKREA